MNLIKDNRQFDRFVNMMPDLIEDEVFFISLSARNKYLTDKEREYYGLGRTEMFGRTVIKEKEDFEFAMKKLATNLTYKTTKNNLLIPEHALVVYVNVNPSSMIKAYEMLQHKMNQELFQVYHATKHRQEVNYDGFKRLERQLLNCIQKSRGSKHYIDLDFDCNEDILKEFYYTLFNGALKQGYSEFTSKEMLKNIIVTQGGFHVLIEYKWMDTLNLILKNLNLKNINDFIKQLNNLAKEEGGEVIWNKNQMIPVPGTMQARHLVTYYE